MSLDYAITLNRLSKLLKCTHNTIKAQAKRGGFPKPVLIGKREKYQVSELRKIFPGLLAGLLDRQMQDKKKKNKPTEKRSEKPPR